jgi:hypothetical protein
MATTRITHSKHAGRKAFYTLGRLSRAWAGRPTTDARIAAQERLGGKP